MATLTVLEAATQDTANELLRDNFTFKNIIFLLGKLEHMKKAVDFLGIDINTELVVRKTNLMKWIDSLLATVQWIDLNKKENNLNNKWENSLCNASYTKKITECELNSECSNCRVCGWVNCHCSQSSKNGLSFEQDSDIFPSNISINKDYIKLQGGGRPKLIKPPKIRVISPGHEMINTVSSIFRSFNKYWFAFDNHSKCLYKGKNSCTFCAYRSLSQRLNQPKRESHIMPYELIDQTDIFSIDTSQQLPLEYIMNQTISLMTQCNGEFQSNGNINIICKGCGQHSRIDNTPLITVENENQNKDISIILQTILNNFKERCMPCCNDCIISQISDDQLFLFIMFKEKRQIDINQECIIEDKKFVYLSHVQEYQEHDNLNYIAHFIYQDLFLHQVNQNILLSNVEEMKQDVKFMAYARKIDSSMSMITPYQKVDLYEKSENRKRNKKLTEESENSKRTRKEYEQSEDGTQTRMSYEQSEDGIN